MLNAVRTLEKKSELTDRERVYLELVREGLERVGSIARRVLDFSPKSMSPQPFRLADAVEGARALVNHRLRRQRVELAVDLPEDLPELVGDRHEFQQVLLNLFLNSLDVLEGEDGAPSIEVRARRTAAGGVEIEVEDNGPGMPTEDLDRVVDPFYSAKGRPDASGLGMFISYSIVRNHGGELELDSAPGQGFRATIRLPGSDPT
jgi:signal transduction histidine kinase